MATQRLAVLGPDYGLARTRTVLVLALAAARSGLRVLVAEAAPADEGLGLLLPRSGTGGDLFAVSGIPAEQLLIALPAQGAADAAEQLAADRDLLISSGGNGQDAQADRMLVVAGFEGRMLEDAAVAMRDAPGARIVAVTALPGGGTRQHVLMRAAGKLPQLAAGCPSLPLPHAQANPLPEATAEGQQLLEAAEQLLFQHLGLPAGTTQASFAWMDEIVQVRQQLPASADGEAAESDEQAAEAADEPAGDADVAADQPAQAEDELLASAHPDAQEADEPAGDADVAADQPAQAEDELLASAQPDAQEADEPAGDADVAADQPAQAEDELQDSTQPKEQAAETDGDDGNAADQPAQAEDELQASSQPDAQEAEAADEPAAAADDQETEEPSLPDAEQLASSQPDEQATAQEPEQEVKKFAAPARKAIRPVDPASQSDRDSAGSGIEDLSAGEPLRAPGKPKIKVAGLAPLKQKLGTIGLIRLEEVADALLPEEVAQQCRQLAETILSDIEAKPADQDSASLNDAFRKLITYSGRIPESEHFSKDKHAGCAYAACAWAEQAAAAGNLQLARVMREFGASQFALENQPLASYVPWLLAVLWVGEVNIFSGKHQQVESDMSQLANRISSLSGDQLAKDEKNIMLGMLAAVSCKSCQRAGNAESALRLEVFARRCCSGVPPELARLVNADMISPKSDSAWDGSDDEPKQDAAGPAADVNGAEPDSESIAAEVGKAKKAFGQLAD